MEMSMYSFKQHFTPFATLLNITQMRRTHQTVIYASAYMATRITRPTQKFRTL